MDNLSQSETDRQNKIIAQMRRSYGEAGLGDLPAEPIALFREWLAAAHQVPAVVEANAMVLSTIDADNNPWSRSVLLKGVSDSPAQFVFFSNYTSSKAAHLAIHPRASLLFPWYAMERQVIVTGSVAKVSRQESLAYFQSRPWASQIGAWASHQSAPLDSPASLSQAWDEIAKKYPEGSSVPLPEFWGGYALTPKTIEFWQGRYSRLHDRARFSRLADSPTEKAPNQIASNQIVQWEVVRLFP